MPSEQDERDAAASRFVAALGGVQVTVTQLLGARAHSTAVFTATLISMTSIAVGVQTGLLLWRAAIQLTSSPNRRAMHD